VKHQISVGHRLILLVAFQTAIAALLLFTALSAMSAVATDARYMYQFQFLSVGEIGKAMEIAARLQSFFATESFGVHPGKPVLIPSVVSQLEAFYKRYRAEWETAKGNTPDAIRFRKDLLGTGDTDFLEKESKALMDLEESIQTLKADEESSSADKPVKTRWSNARKVRENLAELYDVNVGYARLANEHVVSRTRSARNRLFTIGILGTALTLFLGMFVHNAIAPRIRRLVTKVNRFREFGVHEQIVETGKDEITVLAHALDSGFAAIAAREREREEFLAVAAHELKTPITSIHGYASLLISHPEQTSLVPRALEIIYRQSWRLSRLIEDLFLAMRARAGQLLFQPTPLDLSGLVQRLLGEVSPLISHEAFSAQVKPSVKILGDEALLDHALWSLFVCASALSGRKQPVNVVLDSGAAFATVSIDVQGSENSAQEIEALFTPFRSVQYESGSGIRAAVGLFLCRQIVRVHNGRLRVRDVSHGGAEFLMELPL
jgi:signal transduction histidine kinase